MGVLHLINIIAHALDEGKFCLGIFLDLSKAFDTIDHRILLSKLQFYGIRGISLDWFRSYLQNRMQYVVVNGVKSLSTHIHCGVPQGSVLGPILFLVYINDIINATSYFSYSLFADDTSLLASDKDVCSLISTANDEINKLYMWFCCNKLLLNIQKTQYVIFRTRGKRIPTNAPPLIIGGLQAARSENVLFLGVTMNEFMSWKQHIYNVCTRVSRSIGAMSKLRFSVPKDVLTTLYNSIIMPHLTYCNVAWGNTYSSHVHKLQILQKRAIRLITNSHYRSPSVPLFLQLNCLPFNELVSLSALSFMYKLHMSTSPSLFKDLFVRNSDVHSHNTRQKSLIHQPNVATNIALNSFYIFCIKEWNLLPTGIKGSTTFSRFKVMTHKYLFQRLTQSDG